MTFNNFLLHVCLTFNLVLDLPFHYFFIVTKKEYELVTDSDEENPLPSARSMSSPKASNHTTTPVKRESPRKNERIPAKCSPQKKNGRSPRKGSPQKKNKKSPTKVKQSSITSFFKAKS